MSVIPCLRYSLCAVSMAVLAACGGGGGAGDETGSAAGTLSSSGSDSAAVALTSGPSPATGTLAAETEARASALESSEQSTTLLPLGVEQASMNEASSALAVMLSATRATADGESLQTSTVTSASAYYVDNRTGSDVHDGRSPTVGTSGPFKTLARAMAVAVKAGDVVHLACGSVWSETLKPLASGTSSAPIRVTPYPAGCANPPVIDGGNLVPTGLWKLSSGAVYTAPFVAVGSVADSLVPNPTMTSGIGGWAVWSSGNDARIAARSGCSEGGCLALSTGSSAAIVSSGNFGLSADTGYGIRYSLQAPAGTHVRVIVRRSVAPWDILGQDQTVVASGSWQTITTSFRSPVALANARFDVEVRATNATVLVDQVTITAPTADGAPARLLRATNGPARPAHHPNRGFDVSQPDSVYARIAADSDRMTVSNRPASTYLTTGGDLQLPAGATIARGTTVRTRTYAWYMDELAVDRVEGSRVYFQTPSRYPLSAGWGYFLMGQGWMLDSAGEWFHDRSRGLLHAWMANSKVPTAGTTIGYLPIGVDLTARSHVIVEGLQIRHTGTGVAMRRSSGVTVRNALIEDIEGMGIDAGESTGAVVESNVVRRTGSDGISAADEWTNPSTGARIQYNTVRESGVIMEGTAIVGLPSRSFAAIRSGANSTVHRNTIDHAGYIGLRIYAGSTASENVVSNSCMVLDDCGGIYTSAANNNSVISNNIVSTSRGSILGKPAAHAITQAQGIFLDELASGVTVIGNTVINNDNGIQVHVSSRNRIENNKLFGNRNAQVWMQDGTTRTAATGDVYSNTVTGNQMVPTLATTLAFLHSTPFANQETMGHYDANRYFDRVFPTVGSERASMAKDFTLSQWKTALNTSTGEPRNQDATGTGASQGSYAANQSTGPSIVANGSMTVDLAGWKSWNQTAPIGTLVRTTCTGGFCALYKAGGSDGIVSSPNFTVVKDRWYRVSFDLATGVAGQRVGVLVRRGGGGANGYEPLMASPPTITGTTALKRYSFTFKALKSVNVNDPATGDFGARFDFEKIASLQTVLLGKLEIVPITAVDSAVRADILVNATDAASDLACPVAGTSPGLCSIYVRLADNTSITWPRRIAARSSEIVYTLDKSLLDSDADGVPDSQDRCAASPMGGAVNAQGCGLGQTPA